MALVNGLYVVQGEANAVLALLRKFRRSQTRQQLPLLDEHNPLLRNFADLRDVLNKVLKPKFLKIKFLFWKEKIVEYLCFFEILKISFLMEIILEIYFLG